MLVALYLSQEAQRVQSYLAQVFVYKSAPARGNQCPMAETQSDAWQCECT